MRQLVRAKSHHMSWLLDVGIASRDICPMAELVTASDCYLALWKSSSEGREFEPHWGSSFLQILSLLFPANSAAFLRICHTLPSRYKVRYSP